MMNKTILHKNYILSMKSFRAKLNQVFLVIMGCTVLVQVHGQADKRLVQAEEYFAAGEYFTAAGLYAQFLNPQVKTRTSSGFPLNLKKNTEGSTGKFGNKTDILFKQAESYRLANYWTDAAKLYGECYEQDSIKFVHALYWNAVAQRSLGNYQLAEKNLSRFLKESPADHPMRDIAAKEQETLRFIRIQLSKPDSQLYHVQKIRSSEGTDKGVFAPTVAVSNQVLLTSTQYDSVASGTNPYHNRLYFSALRGGSLQNMEPVLIEGLDLSSHQGAASLGQNGRYLYFTQWKRINGQSISSIYFSAKTENGWSQPQLLTSVNEQGANSKHPFCSADGKYLFFASDRQGGQGNFDIWYAPVLEDGTTGAPLNAGAQLNSTGNEQSPFYHSATGTLVFASDRMPGMGGYDLFSSKGWATNWRTPENLGYPINSARDDVYFYATGSGALLDQAYFSSDRGSECCLGTYMVSKSHKRKVLAGLIIDCNSNEPLAEAKVTMKDAAGVTLQSLTSQQGKYYFEMKGDPLQYQFAISKDKYSEKLADALIESRNETNWQTDTLYQTATCLEKKQVILVENVVSVFFDFDKSEVTTRGREQLDSIYVILINDSSASIQISGYTDGLGSAAYNKKLSDKRAKACADYLISKGLNPAVISFESFGACCPIEMELINGRDNPDGRSMNRRALININKN